MRIHIYLKKNSCLYTCKCFIVRNNKSIVWVSNVVFLLAGNGFLAFWFTSLTVFSVLVPVRSHVIVNDEVGLKGNVIRLAEARGICNWRL
jgi:hypothetical protein